MLQFIATPDENEEMINYIAHQRSQLLAKNETHYMGLLGAIINHYADNPNIEFIRALLSVFRGINLPKISIRTQKVDPKIFKNSKAVKDLMNNITQQFASQPTSTQPVPDALILSSVLQYEIYPELIQELAPYASVKSLLTVLAEFVNSSYINSRFLIGSQPMINCVSDVSNVDLLALRIGANSVAAAKYCVFLYYPNGGPTRKTYLLPCRQY